MFGKSIAAVLILLLACSASILAEIQTTSTTVLDGVYSETQGTRGQTLYTALCGACHGNALEGVSAPALADNRFIEKWREGSLDNIYNFIRQRMPLGRSPNASRISDGDYLDILTYILQVNGYRSGPSDLATDSLKDVMLVGKNGPRPVPDGALVVTVGCLSQSPNGVWILSSATDPVRTRTEITSTPAELKTSGQKGLGTLTFRLTDIDAVPDFTPEEHQGHKMQAKGYLVRQPNAERIGLSSIQMVDSTCRP